MTFSKWSKNITVLLVISLLSISFSGALATSAYAADAKSIFKSSGRQDSNIKTAAKSSAAIDSILNKVIGGKNSNVGNKTIKVNPFSIFTNPFKALPNSKNPTAKNEPGQDNTSQNNASGLTSYEQEAVNLLNADRSAQGLPPLKVNMDLVRLAEAYAQDMIDRNFFAHENPEGLSPFDRMKNAGISYRWAGENLAINSSVSAAQKAFMSSAGHRANILNGNFTQVGIGVKRDGNGSFYVVQEFIGI